MSSTKIARKNLMLEEKKLQALRKILGSPSESEAVREAIDRILAGEEIIAAFQRVRKRGTWADHRRQTA